MKLTRLKLVQRVLSKIRSENVQSIGDTEESEDVAMIVDEVYEYILSRFGWAFLSNIIQLEITSDQNTFRIPTDVYQVNWVRYDGNPVGYIDPEEMEDIEKKQDGAPTYWTSYDDVNIIVDNVETTTSGSDFRVEALIIPDLLVNDTDIPALPARFFPTLFYGAVADAARTLKKDYGMSDRYKQEFKRGIMEMQAWAYRARRKRGPGYSVDYSRK